MPQREHLLKIGVSGIRGVVGEFLTPALACAFAQAFGTYVGSGRVVIGRDTRASGPMLQHAVTCGLLATGCDVLDVGVLPTPTIQIFTGATRARGGIAVTASHNPPEYNALKLFNAQGRAWKPWNTAPACCPWAATWPRATALRGPCLRKTWPSGQRSGSRIPPGRHRPPTWPEGRPPWPDPIQGMHQAGTGAWASGAYHPQVTILSQPHTSPSHWRHLGKTRIT